MGGLDLSSSSMSVLAFIDLDEIEQVAELRGFLKSKGSEISEENTSDGLVSNLQQVIDATAHLWKEGTDQELESLYNSVISLLLVVPTDKNEPLVINFCDKVGSNPSGDKKNFIRVKLLSHLFHGLDDRSSHRYIVFMTLMQLANKQADLVQYVNPQLSEIKKWIAQWDITNQKVQTLLRSVHEGFLEAKESEQATKVMIELLGTYTEDNASQAREDAHKCIVTCLSDPSTFLMDHLLALKPVKFLEGELIHDLLTIFVSGKLSQYVHFYENNKEFINSIGLQHEENMQKMRLLTFMQMAENKTEIDFDLIQKEMKLDADDVESFIIDVIRTKSVNVKIDQMSRKVLVTNTTHRTFGKQQWQSLREQLNSWRANLDVVLGSLQTVTPR